ncbi:zinc finger CCCH type domain protein (macronuclear) [Tetrahymena thermophila SB210]|uniref:Zinc finger CCCH type domain protein n=1 Tax=Tetrahymena thermophila (strain SB210) TaxID=312017 RepID=I7M3Z8_TETTS|nr:zinc finger CCCH type domain protein [Tetrahymena thermophila SB210]EAS04616.3 zinc finger CCCH type domain protein [Tetrahymena thermophila SB210]|eukprot:XP_001024861.3 zinc finger CCCH type domain protein [Tetrahymena thermophila SB210]
MQMSFNQQFTQSGSFPIQQYPSMNGSTYSYSKSINMNAKNQSDFRNSLFSTNTDGPSSSQIPQQFQGQFSNNDLRFSPPTSYQQQQQQNIEKGYIEHLDLSTFKIEKCKITENHNIYRCPYYHNSNDRRRVCQVLSEQCDQGDRCSLKDQCPKAHSSAEVHYSKDQYKKKFCKHIKNLNNCEYGNYCSYAHSEQDILIELIHLLEKDDDFYMFHYKTVMCPFIDCQQRDKCEYYHNTQDFRRRPDQYSYEPETCPKWPSKDQIKQYEKGCPEGYNCNKCHGWKELDYHPKVYKTRSCEKCKKQQHCPHYHNSKEKRQVPDTVLQKIFRLVPKNSFYLQMKKQLSSSLNNSLNNNENSSFTTNNSRNNNSSFMNSQIQPNPASNSYQSKILSQSNVSQQDMFMLNQNILQFQNSMINNNGANSSIQLGLNGARGSNMPQNMGSMHFQIFNDQISNPSNFQVSPQQMASSDFLTQSQMYQFKQQFQVFNPQDSYSESQVLNNFEQSNRFNESNNLQIIKESPHTSNLSSSIAQNTQNSNNWVSNNQQCESDEENSSPNFSNRKRSNSEGEMNEQLQKLHLSQNQYCSRSQNDLNNSDKSNSHSKASGQSPIKQANKKSKNKQQYIVKEYSDSNSQGSRNQLSDDYNQSQNKPNYSLFDQSKTGKQQFIVKYKYLQYIKNFSSRQTY